jgi:hypothetical protein
VDLDFALELLAIALIGGECGTAGFETALVRLKLLLDLCDVDGKSGDFLFEARDLAIERLQLDGKSKVLQHLFNDLSTQIVEFLLEGRAEHLEGEAGIIHLEEAEGEEEAGEANRDGDEEIGDIGPA